MMQSWDGEETAGKLDVCTVDFDHFYRYKNLATLQGSGARRVSMRQ